MPCPVHLPISEQRLASAATAALAYTWLSGSLEADSSQRQRPTMTSTRTTASRPSTTNFFMALLHPRGKEQGQDQPQTLPGPSPTGNSLKSGLRNTGPGSPSRLPECVHAVQAWGWAPPRRSRGKEGTGAAREPISLPSPRGDKRPARGCPAILGDSGRCLHRVQDRQASNRGPAWPGGWGG